MTFSGPVSGCASLKLGSHLSRRHIPEWHPLEDGGARRGDRNTSAGRTPGFYFGRFDVRHAVNRGFSKEGEFKIIELKWRFPPRRLTSMIPP